MAWPYDDLNDSYDDVLPDGYGAQGLPSGLGDTSFYGAGGTMGMGGYTNPMLISGGAQNPFMASGMIRGGGLQMRMPSQISQADDPRSQISMQDIAGTQGGESLGIPGGLMGGIPQYNPATGIKGRLERGLFSLANYSPGSGSIADQLAGAARGIIGGRIQQRNLVLQSQNMQFQRIAQIMNMARTQEMIRNRQVLDEYRMATLQRQWQALNDRENAPIRVPDGRGGLRLINPKTYEVVGNVPGEKPIGTEEEQAFAEEQKKNPNLSRLDFHKQWAPKQFVINAGGGSEGKPLTRNQLVGIEKTKNVALNQLERGYNYDSTLGQYVRVGAKPDAMTGQIPGSDTLSPQEWRNRKQSIQNEYEGALAAGGKNVEHYEYPGETSAAKPAPAAVAPVPQAAVPAAAPKAAGGLKIIRDPKTHDIIGVE